MSVSAIIPAYNEEKTIGNLLRVVKSVPLIEEIIVVSDGSTDATARIAENYGISLIELPVNIGKSGAIKAGLDICNYETILLLDADLIGLNMYHIYNLLMPLTNNETDMTIGIFKHGRTVTDLAQRIAPKLSGQRALKKCILEKAQDLDLTRFGLEIALTKVVANGQYRVKEVYLHDVTHLTKEEKAGVIHGLSLRMKMYWDIVKTMNRDIK